MSNEKPASSESSAKGDQSENSPNGVIIGIAMTAGIGALMLIGFLFR